MKADIVYTGGLSYTIGATRFRYGETVTTEDKGLIQNCALTAGFTVNITEPRTIRHVEPTVSAKESEEETAGAPEAAGQTPATKKQKKPNK